MERTDNIEMDDNTLLVSTANSEADKIHQQIDELKIKIEAEDENISHSAFGISKAPLEIFGDEIDSVERLNDRNDFTKLIKLESPSEADSQQENFEGNNSHQLTLQYGL